LSGDGFKVRYYFEGRTIGRNIGGDRARFLSEMIVGNPVVTRDRFVWDHWQSRPPALDDRGLMNLYFDASLYFDGSGPRCVMFRLPASLNGMLQPYLTGDASHGVTAEAAGADLIVRIARHEQDGELMYCDDTPQQWLESMLPLRSSLLSGDPAALYLGWRMAAEDRAASLSPSAPDPPRPQGLDSLSPPLEALDQILRPWQSYGPGSSRP
jgi:hypothetical protein